MKGNHSLNPDYGILSAFERPIIPPRTSFLYQCGLLFVAAAMVLLPLIYLAIVGGAAYGVFYHAVHHFKPIMQGGGAGMLGFRMAVLKFFVYVVPLIAGGIVVFFLFKPIFARRPKRAQPLALNPASEPLLFAFIERICQTVGAPSPRRIDLDCQLNASAGFRRGFLSFLGDDLVLTIGMPLAANLTAREFAGVIAHEFGHFTQGLGMRLCNVILRVNHWFARVVYQRDAWDVALEEWARDEEDWQVAIVLGTARLGIWFSRTILSGLMFAGFFIAGFMLRQMEYDADAYQIKVAGSEAFERTFRKLSTLGAALDGTYKQLRISWNNTRHLPDNLPKLLQHAHLQLPPGVQRKIDDSLGFQRTGAFDTHPSPADRIRRARRASDPGMLHDERPASSLFASFEHPARFVTLLHYQDDLGIPILPDMLLPVEPDGSESEAQLAPPRVPANQVGDDYFFGILPLLPPLRLETPAPSTDYEADAHELSQTVSSLHQVSDQLAPIATRFAEAAARAIQARAAQCLLKAGVTLRVAEFSLAADTVEAAHHAETEALSACEELRHSVREVAVALNRRLQLALSLKWSEPNEPEAVSPARQIAELITSANQAADRFPHWQEVSDALAVLGEIIKIKDAEGESPALARALTQQTDAIKSLCDQQTAMPDAAQPAARLQISKRPSHVNQNDSQALQKQARLFFAEYHSRIGQITELALSVEQISA